jgi:DNA phosphorothioation-dependent restriction protein DptF
VLTAVLPALRENFPDATAYSNHLNSELEALASKGEIEFLPNGMYRVTFDSSSSPLSSETEVDTPDSTTSEAAQSKTTDHDISDQQSEDLESQPSMMESELETSSLYELLRSCQMGEAGAIVGGHIDRNDLRKELYIETQEDEILADFFVNEYERDGKHLIITGSAGDGKSALLSQAFNKAQNEGIALEQRHIHMDATASRGKHQTYDETLSEFLTTVSENLATETGPRTGLAINLGLAIDFFERLGHQDRFHEIWEAIDSTRNRLFHETDQIIVVNLSHRSTYNTSPGALGDGLLTDLVEKFAFDDPQSPFHDAYQQTEERCPVPEECPLHYNAHQFTDPELRAEVVELIAASGLLNNIYLNPRAILDIISKMIVPEHMQSVADTDTECPVGRSTQYNRQFEPGVIIWNSVFNRLAVYDDDGHGYLDPTAQADKRTDEKILDWSANSAGLAEVLADVPVVDGASLIQQARTALRKQYLHNESDIRTAKDWSWFTEFTGALTFFDPPEGTNGSDHRRKASQATETITNALKGWTGHATMEDWVEFVDGIQGEYKFLSKWEKPTPDIETSSIETKEETIPGQLWIVLKPGNETLQIPVPVTFELYMLMKRVSRGYRPNSRDLERSEGIRLIHSRLSEFTDKQNTVRVMDKSDESVLRLERDPFGEIQLETGGSV